MKKIEFFCDICSKEFPPQEYSFLTGQIIKIDEKLKPNLIPFEGHYCGKDTQLILEEITKIKDAKHINSTTVHQESIQERPDNGIKQ